MAKGVKKQSTELWITEYGDNQDKTKAIYYTKLTSFANFVENYANDSIALSHQIIG